MDCQLTEELLQFCQSVFINVKVVSSPLALTDSPVTTITLVRLLRWLVPVAWVPGLWAINGLFPNMAGSFFFDDQ